MATLIVPLEFVQSYEAQDIYPDNTLLHTFYVDVLREYRIQFVTVHLLYAYWATEQWRWYIQWLEDVVEFKVGSFLEAPLDSMPHSNNSVLD